MSIVDWEGDEQEQGKWYGYLYEQGRSYSGRPFDFGLLQVNRSFRFRSDLLYLLRSRMRTDIQPHPVHLLELVPVLPCLGGDPMILQSWAMYFQGRFVLPYVRLLTREFGVWDWDEEAPQGSVFLVTS